MNSSLIYPRIAVVSACVAMSIGFIGPTQAAPVLDFGITAPTAGSIDYTGGVNPLSGVGIEVDNIVGLDTSSNNNIVSDCIGCSLDFMTGGFSGVSGNSWVFTGGGTITVTGAVDFPGATADIPAGTTLLSGSFSEAQVVDLGGNAFEFQIVAGAFTDTKDPELLAFYGLPDVNYVGGLNISFQVSGTAAPGDAFTSAQILSGDITNQPVPVPAAVWLFGSGLLGFTMVGRRRKS